MLIGSLAIVLHAATAALPLLIGDDVPILLAGGQGVLTPGEEDAVTSTLGLRTQMLADMGAPMRQSTQHVTATAVSDASTFEFGLKHEPLDRGWKHALEAARAREVAIREVDARTREKQRAEDALRRAEQEQSRADGYQGWLNTIRREHARRTRVRGEQILADAVREQGVAAGATTLNLSHHFDGQLPGKLGQLSQLIALDVSHNNLTSLPPELGNLTNLEELNVEGNRLQALPTELCRLTHLRSLWLDGNSELRTRDPALLKLLLRLAMEGRSGQVQKRAMRRRLVNVARRRAQGGFGDALSGYNRRVRTLSRREVYAAS